MRIDFKHFSATDLKFLKPKTVFEAKVIQFIKEWLNEDETTQVQTSGSTGKPKIIKVNKSTMRISARKTCDFLNLKARMTALLCLPIEYISGKMMLVRAIERKLTIDCVEPSLSSLIQLKSQFDFCALTPLQLSHSLDKLHLINKIIVGGAAVSSHLQHQIVNQLDSSKKKPQIFESFGMSETLSHIALKEIYPNSKEYFTLLEGVEISTDARGCLNINAPELYPETIITNDLVEIINPKQFKFLGRLDFIINSGGAKIHPETVERLIQKYVPYECQIFGSLDQCLGETVSIFIETGVKAVDLNTIKKTIQSIIFEKKFHQPKRIILVEQLERTPNGKINRRENINKYS